MKIVIRNAKIIDSKSPYHNKTVDILIADDYISKIGNSLVVPENYQEIQIADLHVSVGWFDSSVSLGEPGFEDRETIQNGLETAAKSGFSGIALQPNTFPVIDNQSQVHFVKNKAKGAATELFPIAALTIGSEGKDMSELFDMKNAGAIAFGDYNRSIENTNLLKIALQYVQDFDGLVIAFSQDEKIKGNGVANEGIVSTRLGLKGIPNLAEEIQISRNLSLLEYTGGKLHIPTISTAKSLVLIQEAKTKGLKVSCSVAVHHLVMTDEKLEEFDTHYKLNPPLRNESDRLALIEGVKNGIIDMITSDHNPIDIENKKMDFDNAKSGTIGLESAFGALLTVLPLETVIEKLTAGRAIFGLENLTITEGAKANLSLFSPQGKSIFTANSIYSKSKNSAFIGTEQKGKVFGIFNQNQLILNL